MQSGTPGDFGGLSRGNDTAGAGGAWRPKRVNVIRVLSKWLKYNNSEVVATHQPTGTKRGTATEVNGGFNIPNLAPGGPYEVQVTYVGYKPQTIGGVYLTLGNTARLNPVLAAEAQALSEVGVVGNTEATKTGAGTTASREALQQLPTISRSIQDFTRLDPRNSNNSFAGSSFRYNNLPLDGAVNNDAIGFSPSLGGQGGTSGLPGGSARANPISLDAIQEFQAQVAPYDVKLGNFTGGSINAVTRSGTNDFRGSVYGYGRHQNVTGRSVDGAETKIGPTTTTRLASGWAGPSSASTSPRYPPSPP